jgi:hypothetical protein
VGDGDVVNFIPVRLIGSDGAGNEEMIGDFPEGIVLQEMSVIHIQSRQNIANLVNIGNKTLPIFRWEVPRLKKNFKYLFFQVMPEGDSVEVDVGGGVRKRFF